MTPAGQSPRPRRALPPAERNYSSSGFRAASVARRFGGPAPRAPPPFVLLHSSRRGAREAASCSLCLTGPRFPAPLSWATAPRRRHVPRSTSAPARKTRALVPGRPSRPGPHHLTELLRGALASQSRASEKREDAEGFEKSTPKYSQSPRTSLTPPAARQCASVPCEPGRLGTRGKADRSRVGAPEPHCACAAVPAAGGGGPRLCVARGAVTPDCPAPGRRGRWARLPEAARRAR